MTEDERLSAQLMVVWMDGLETVSSYWNRMPNVWLETELA